MPRCRLWGLYRIAHPEMTHRDRASSGPQRNLAFLIAGWEGYVVLGKNSQDLRTMQSWREKGERPHRVATPGTNGEPRRSPKKSTKTIGFKR